MKKILLIDDDRILRTTVSKFLSIKGEYTILTAGDGREGVEAAQVHLPDLIICDVTMPHLDGYGVLQALQAQPQTAGIPFIFLTGHADRRSTRRGMELGADDYLAKPFLSSELQAAIEVRLAKQAVLQSHYEAKIATLRDNILLAVPHELRSPLSIIIGYSDILADDPDAMTSTQIRQLSQSIHKAGRRLYHLVENYIIYAQIELVQTEPGRVERMRALTAVTPDEIVESIANKLAKANNRSIQFDLMADHIQVAISEVNLGKIVEELVDNALKFSARETAVFIKTEKVDQRFYMSIKDFGRGMTPEQIHNIGGYMQFVRKIHEQQGSGMGLIIAMRLTELYGGELTITSDLGNETCVEVYLPVLA